MERFCQNCQTPNPTQKCSKCPNMYYCNRTCQTIHWPMHKYLCGKSGSSIQEQTQGLIDGVLHFNFLNPREDRTIETYGADTRTIEKLDHHSRKIIKLLNLDQKNVKMMYVDEKILLPYGLCLANVNTVIKKHGGKAIRGWTLWEGKYIIEAEFHVVWLPNNEKEIINVTENIDHRPYSGLFIPDPGTDNLKKAPSNIIYWKE
jgi:MYND finger